MKQEEKDLLLQDLCSRLPYGVKCKDGYAQIEGKLCQIGINYDMCLLSDEYGESKWAYIPNCKPYLFPLSSMTEEQKNELYEMCEELYIGFNSGTFTDMSGYGDIGIHKIQPIINYLLKNYFDIYGLIPMGLAKDATNLNIY